MSSTAELAARREGISVQELPQWVNIVDCEKRRGSTRFYTYVIEVAKKNKEKYYIYRRYSKFHKMCTRLEERFPVESGSLKASDRILPTLPGKKFLGRSAIREVADKRLPLLNDFLQKLLLLSDNIKYDSIVINFLKPKHEDVTKPYTGKLAYPQEHISKRAPPNGLGPLPDRPKPPRTMTTPLLILEGTSSSTPTKPYKPPPPILPSKISTSVPNSKPALPPPPKKKGPSHPISSSSGPKTRPPVPLPAAMKGPRARALYGYKGLYGDELSFAKGCVVALIRKLEGDWYEGKVDGKVGLVPGNYLEIIEPLSSEDDGSSSEDEWDDEMSTIKCHYKGRIVMLQVTAEIARRPTMVKLLNAVRAQLRDARITLNYKDSAGDLIEITDDSDLQLMLDTCRSKSSRLQHQSNVASWVLHVTKQGDTSLYNTKPY